MPSWHRVTIPKNKRPPRPGRVSFYDSKRWRTIRARHIGRNPECVACGRAATECDHISGDHTDNRPENLQALCKACHSRKTARADGAFGRARLDPTDARRCQGAGDATKESSEVAYTHSISE